MGPWWQQEPRRRHQQRVEEQGGRNFEGWPEGPAIDIRDRLTQGRCTIHVAIMDAGPTRRVLKPRVVGWSSLHTDDTRLLPGFRPMSQYEHRIWTDGKPSNHMLLSKSRSVFRQTPPRWNAPVVRCARCWSGVMVVQPSSASASGWVRKCRAGRSESSGCTGCRCSSSQSGSAPTEGTCLTQLILAARTPRQKLCDPRIGSLEPVGLLTAVTGV
jgi:hypothetical protein